MQPKENQPILQCDNLIASARGITETSGKKVALFVPAGEIERIELKFGKSDHRPMVSLVIGGILAMGGIVGLIGFIHSPRGYRIELGLVAFGLLGASMIHEAVKERHFLEVHTKKGASRLVFSKKAQRSEIREFCGQVRAVYQHQIDESV